MSRIFALKFFRGRFVEQMHMLSCRSMCDQIQRSDSYESVQALLLLKSDLDVQRTYLWLV
jgi:hypothetical protein